MVSGNAEINRHPHELFSRYQTIVWKELARPLPQQPMNVMAWHLSIT